MKGHFKIIPYTANGLALGQEYMVRLNGDVIDLRTKDGAKIDLKWVTDKAAELEFALMDAEDADQAMAALDTYVYTGWKVEEWSRPMSS